MIERVCVVIPARNEEDSIGRCLESITRAIEGSPVPVTVTVVADGCLDQTARLARSFTGVRVIEIDSCNVGESRRVGVGGRTSPATWIANTDSDSVVPENWISSQVALANAGNDVVVGTVRPDFADLSAVQQEAWLALRQDGRPNGHVHGTNLGFRASVYAAVGGYRPLAEHEDADLVARLTGYRSVASDDAEVITSGRTVGRSPGGYARYLREDLVRIAEESR